MDQSLKMFLFGIAGSAAIEVLKILSIYESGRQFPARYKKKGFWFVRALLALIGGLLAWAYGVQSTILAFHIGAATPVILENLSRSRPD